MNIRTIKLRTAIVLAMSTPFIPSLMLNQASAAEIEEIIITGARIEESIPQDLSRYGSRVDVITAEDIVVILNVSGFYSELNQ